LENGLARVMAKAVRKGVVRGLAACGVYDDDGDWMCEIILRHITDEVKTLCKEIKAVASGHNNHHPDDSTSCAGGQ